MVNYKDTPLESTSRYFRPSMAVDGVVFTMFNTKYSKKNLYSGELHVLLIKRDAVQRTGKPRPDRGYWAFPGGFMRSGENLESSVLRELEEETSIEFNNPIVNIQQVKTYSEPKRDAWNFDKDVPKGKHRQTLSTAFLVLAPSKVFTLALAMSDFYLKDSKVIPMDMDLIMNNLMNEMDPKKPYEEDIIFNWNAISNMSNPDKFLQEHFNVDLIDNEHLGPTIENLEYDKERKIQLSKDREYGDAKAAAFFPVKDVLANKIEKGRLAFDHSEILKDSIDAAVSSMAWTPSVFGFLEEEFTIADIRGAYQAFWDVKYGKSEIPLGNFQTKILNLTDSSGNKLLIPTRKKRPQKGKGAPAAVYTRNKKVKEFSLSIVPNKNL